LACEYFHRWDELQCRFVYLFASIFLSEKVFFLLFLLTAGLMVNYKYDLALQEDNMKNFQLTGGSFPLGPVIPQDFHPTSLPQSA
jgi:hypothetical protein